MKLYNTITREIGDFRPLSYKSVKIYVCGITPYDTTHLGHAFTYLSFDALIRYLEYKKFKVNYTQNVTDINDRDNDILKRAREQNISWDKLADFWTNIFLTDMQNLNWRKPDNYLFASKEIEKMSMLIEQIINNGLAYEVNGSVYLDISKIKDYGKFSRLTNVEMLKIAKNYEEDIENLDKKNKLDITLWRKSGINQPSHIPSFNSLFGNGRPGWHLECSSMAINSLGRQIDIHGGGRDLIFPHHEAEIAQSESATGLKPFSKYWMHTGMIYFAGEKMSKSLGNLVLVSDLLKKYSANTIRLYLLSHHYRSDWEFKFEDIDQFQNEIDRLNSFLANDNLGDINEELMIKFQEMMNLDLNTKEALNFILDLAHENKNSSSIREMLKVLGFNFN
jgi:cysteinyl-tRNA synthetase